jgi:hypothetical protein
MLRAGSTTPTMTGRHAWRCWEMWRANVSLTQHAAQACTPPNWSVAGHRWWGSTTARGWCSSAGARQPG